MYEVSQHRVERDYIREGSAEDILGWLGGIIKQDEKNGRLRGPWQGRACWLEGGTGVLRDTQSSQEDSGMSRLQKPTVLCGAKETLIDG